MGIQTSPEASGGVWKAVKDALGLFSNTNKYSGIDDNTNPTPMDEYESSLNEVEIMKLISEWKKSYRVYYEEIEKGQKLSFDYWVGKQKSESDTGLEERGSIDNLIFEAVETFLPIATRSNPEPLVIADPTEMGQILAKDIKIALVDWADKQKLRRKLAKMTRKWLIDRIGVLKLSFNPLTKTIDLTVPNPKNMIFDKDGYVDESGQFVGDYLAEKKTATARKLLKMFPKRGKEILAKARNKMGTKLEYYEWWYMKTDVIFTLEDILLGKYKNPNWNYDIDAKPAKEPVLDENGQIIEEGELEQAEVKGVNHLEEMCYPYRFLSIFTTGEQPHDNTSLILQNIPQQDKINRRERQIEKNVQGMNNGLVVSGQYYTAEQASQAASALRRGVAILQPSGNLSEGIMFPNRPGLPADVYAHLKDGRQELRNIFGTAGSTAEGVKSQETVRGKIMINQMDSSRIGGGITEYIEQVADSIYNLVVQFMFVYYDEEHFIANAGQQAGMEIITLKNNRFVGLKTLNITVKEGSLIPKDPLTQRNEAIDLWSAGAIDPLSLYKKLDFPDPAEATKQLILWQLLQRGAIQPQMYLPNFNVAQPMQQPLGQPQGVGGPAVNAPTGTDMQPNPNPSAQPSEQVVSQQLLQSVPIR